MVSPMALTRWFAGRTGSRRGLLMVVALVGLVAAGYALWVARDQVLDAAVASVAKALTRASPAGAPADAIRAVVRTRMSRGDPPLTYLTVRGAQGGCWPP